MKRLFTATGLLACALITAACQAPATPPAAPDTREADAKAIRDNEEAWNKDFEAKDASKIAAHYTDDAVLMSPGMPPASGKDAIAKVLSELVKDPALALKFQASTVEVAKSGDLAYSQGSYTMTMTNEKTKKPMTDKGSYVTVYKKQPDGAWKAVRDINVSESPSAPAPPANK
jgi:uncharacterized protein (TIGR02246 family)